MGIPPEQLGPFVSRQRDRGATELRVRLGASSTTLKVIGSIDLLVDGLPRSVDEVVAELVEDLGVNGYPGELPCFAVDAMGDGKVMKSAQHTDGQAVGAAAKKPTGPAGSIPESDVSRLITAFVESNRHAVEAQARINVALIEQLGKETAARREAEAAALGAERMAAEAALEAEAERLAAAFDAAQNSDDDGLKERGLGMLEKLVGKMDAGAKMDAANLKKWAKAHPEEMRKMAADPEVIDLILAAGADADTPPSPSPTPPAT